MFPGVLLLDVVQALHTIKGLAVVKHSHKGVEELVWCVS